MNFEDLFGGGGFPGGRGFTGGGGMGMPQRPQGDKEALYRELGLDSKANADTIKKAYRNLAKKHHPDRGGDADKFKKIQNAYDVLSDEEKKRAYDATGDPNADPNMLSNGRRKRKGKPTEFELEVPMEQYFTGATRRIKVTKTVICEACSGRGGASVVRCPGCQGRGAKIVDRQIGHNMIQRMQMECDRCNGKGEIIPDGSKCIPCRATGMKKESKVLAVEILKGMKHGEKIVFNEEGDQHPDFTPGDIIVKLRQVEHATFKRFETCHLQMEKKISLLEALTGFQFTITHLDGRTLLVTSDPNTIYRDGEFRAIREEGFPLRDAHTPINGHLYIKLLVEMPRSLDASTKTQLKTLLGPVRRRPSVDAAIARKNAAPQVMETDEEEKKSQIVQDVQLEAVDIEQETASYKKLMEELGRAHEQDSDEEGHAGPGNVACRAQ